MEITLKALGLSGAVLYTLAYFLLTTGRVHAHARPYHAMNLVASAAVFSEALSNGTLGAMVVNIIWFAIAGLTLLGVISVANSSRKEHALEASEGLPPKASARRADWRRVLLLSAIVLFIAGMTLIFLSLRDRAIDQARTVRVFISEWDPYVTRDAPGYGPAPRLLTDAAARGGLRVEFEHLPTWQEAYDRVLTSDGVATFPWMDPSESLWRVGESGDVEEAIDEQRRRSRRFQTSQTVGRVDHVVYVRDEDERFDELSSLAGKVICVPRGYQVPKQLVDGAGGVDRVELTRASTVAQGFEELESGKADALYVAAADGERVLRGAGVTLGRDAFRVIHTIPLELHVLYSASGTDTFRERLDRALGEADELLKPSERTVIRFSAHASAQDGEGKTRVVAEGTPAVVLGWSARFGGDETSMRIKPIEGPLAGRVLETEAEAFRLVEGGER